MKSGQTKVIVSLGTSVKNSDIVQKEISVIKLFQNLSKPIIASKKDGKYFIFASFHSNTRNAASVKQYYGATIDLDDTPLTISEIKEKVKKYQYCIYTTFSHQLNGKGDRYRLVLPYKKPVDSMTHVELMLYLMDTLGGAGKVDLSSKALSRPMYLPAISKDRIDLFESHRNTKGILLNPTSPVIREKISALHFKQNETNASHVNESFDINEDVSEGGRNDALARAIGKFIKTGVANSEILSLATAWNQSKLSPPLSSKEVKTVVDSIIKAHRRNHGDLEWGYDEILERIKAAKSIEKEYDHLVDMIASAKIKKKLKQSQVQLLVNSLAGKSKIGKRVVAQEISNKELEIFGKLEDSDDDSVETTLSALKDDFKDWVYVASDDRVYNFRTGEYYKREAFASTFANPNVEGSLITLVMKYNLLKKVSRLEFDPSQEEIYSRGGIKYANTYIPPDIFPMPGDVSVMLRHFEYLIPEDYERNIILDFIAHLVQKPGDKIRWMPVIKGGKGIGKTIIAEKIIMPIIGFTNFGKVNNDLIKADFNAWQLDKQLVVFEELDIGANNNEKEQLTDKLKAFITDNILTAHRKGLDPYDTINKANSLGFTNKDDAIIITVDERRFCMIRSEAKPKRDSYYARLARFVDDHIPEIYNYFLERDLGNFSASKAPETVYTNEIKAFSEGWPGFILRELSTDTTSELHEIGCMTSTQIAEYVRARSTGKFRTYADDLMSPGSSQAKKFYYSLKTAGFTKYENPSSADYRISLNGEKATVWILPQRLNEIKKLSPRLIKRLLNKVKIKDHNWDA